MSLVAEHDFSSRRWRDPAWRCEALRWADENLDRHDLVRTGDAEQVHRRAWSTVLRLPTASGPFWFKANAVGTAHEGPLLAALARWAPEHVLHPLALDARRGWLLLPDGGTTLRTTLAGGTDAARWQDILVEHAELQRAVAPHAEELLELGVPDLRPERLADVRADLLDDEVALRCGLPGGLDSAALDRLRGDAALVSTLCGELAAIGVPASVQHDDLHDNNVFVPGRPGGHYRVFDWGDASVAHPFAVLLVALRVVADRHHLPDGDAELLRLRDAYLEPWSAEFDRPTLIEAARLALRVGGVSRALCYRSALVEGTPADHDEYGDGVPGWLLELHGTHPLDPTGWV
jgi:Phosphotransferase enzyme family